MIRYLAVVIPKSSLRGLLCMRANESRRPHSKPASVGELSSIAMVPVSIFQRPSVWLIDSESEAFDRALGFVGERVARLFESLYFLQLVASVLVRHRLARLKAVVISTTLIFLVCFLLKSPLHGSGDLFYPLLLSTRQDFWEPMR
jgi:hypothetical protein